MKVCRFASNPIIRPHMDARMRANINGPSLIQVPAWLPHPLGRYYLYFAHHQGTYIRLAYADRLEGPWTTYAPGSLDLAQTPFAGHVASPDVHVDEARREIRMYCHGPVPGDGQRSTVARSPDGLSGFEEGPTRWTEHMRHTAVLVDGNRLSVFFSNAYDCPEHILVSTVRLTPDWQSWTPSAPVSVLKPELDYEGAHLPQVSSERGWAPERVHQVRDPGIYREGGRTYLLYTVAGEHGIAMAQLT